MHPNSCLGALYQIVVRKPYCVSRLIQILRGCYRFYIYLKCPKINTFQKGRCTHTWAAIVLLVGIAALSIFQSVKNNDSLFFKVAIVIFCTQKIITNLIQQSRSTEICLYMILHRLKLLFKNYPFDSLHFLQSN